MSGFSFSSPASGSSGGFSFGAGTTGAGSAFSFGTSTTTTSAPAPAFSFGSTVAPSTTSAPTFGGFGQAPLTSVTQGTSIAGAVSASSSTGFGSLKATTPSFGGFGSPAVASGLPTFGGLSTSTTPSTTAAAFGASLTGAPSIGFGTLATSSAPSFSFSSATAASKPTAPTSQTAAPPSFGSFGSPSQIPTQSSSSVSSSFGSTPTLPSGFSLTSVSNPSSLSFGATTTSQSTSTTTTTTGSGPVVNQPGLSLAPTSSSTSSLGFSIAPTPLATTTSAGAFVAPKITDSTATRVTTNPIQLSNPASLTTTTQTTQSSAAPTPAMNFRQLDEALNKWLLDLEEQEKVFLNQATQVNGWDRLLLNNGEKIVVLYEQVEKLKQDQQRLEHELDFVSTQQSELEQILQPLEALMVTAPPPDPERERIYSMAESLDAQLQRMAEDLRKVIDHINSANKSEDDNEPLSQISKVLNAHMDSLQWIDENTASVQKRLEEVQKLHEIRRKDIERVGIL